MDLTNVHDHPAVILTNLAERIDPDGGSYARPALATSAAVLRKYEHDFKVTFAALDNDALAEVNRLRAALGRIEDFHQAGRVAADLETALDALLGEVEV